MSSEPRYTVSDAMQFLRREIGESTDNELFHATKAEKTIEFDYGTTQLEVSRTGFTSKNAARALPNIKYEISLGAITKNAYTPWVSDPSETDADLNKAAFLLCLEYFAKFPNSLTVTKSTQDVARAT